MSTFLYALAFMNSICYHAICKVVVFEKYELGAMAMNILIADDQVLFAENLKIVLETLTDDMKVVGIAEDGNQAVSMAEQMSPDLILMDVSMPNKNGVEATREILLQNPNQKIVILTSMQDESCAAQALKYGAVGYLLKDMRSKKLITALRTINEGMVLLSNATAQSVFKISDRAESGDVETLRLYKKIFDSLNNREIDVIKSLVKGASNQAIANELFLSEPTVRNYISSIYSKFGTNNRMEVIKHGKNIIAFFSGN